MYRVMFLKCYTGSHWKRWMSSKQLISAANSCHIFLHQQYSCSIYIFNVFSWVHSWSWNVMFSARRREVHFLEKVSSMTLSTNCKYCLSQIPISVIVWKRWFRVFGQFKKASINANVHQNNVYSYKYSFFGNFYFQGLVLIMYREKSHAFIIM